jgi:hypothetical protein
MDGYCGQGRRGIPPSRYAVSRGLESVYRVAGLLLVALAGAFFPARAAVPLLVAGVSRRVVVAVTGFVVLASVVSGRSCPGGGGRDRLSPV